MGRGLRRGVLPEDGFSSSSDLRIQTHNLSAGSHSDRETRPPRRVRQRPVNVHLSTGRPANQQPAPEERRRRNVPAVSFSFIAFRFFVILVPLMSDIKQEREIVGFFSIFFFSPLFLPYPNFLCTAL